MESSILGRARQWWAGKPEVRWDDSLHGFRFATRWRRRHHSLQGTARRSRRSPTSTRVPSFRWLASTNWGSGASPTFSTCSAMCVDELASIALRVRGSGKPGGIGHEVGVKARYIEKRQTHITEGSDVRSDTREHRTRNRPMPSPRVYVSPPSQTEVDRAAKHGREPSPTFFIPSFNTDNPGLDLRRIPRGSLPTRCGDIPTTRDGDFDAIFSANTSTQRCSPAHSLGRAEGRAVGAIVGHCRNCTRRRQQRSRLVCRDGGRYSDGENQCRRHPEEGHHREHLARAPDPSDLDPFHCEPPPTWTAQKSRWCSSRSSWQCRQDCRPWVLDQHILWPPAVVTQSNQGRCKAMAWLPLVTQVQQRNVWLVAG